MAHEPKDKYAIRHQSLKEKEKQFKTQGIEIIDKAEKTTAGEVKQIPQQEWSTNGTEIPHSFVSELNRIVHPLSLLLAIKAEGDNLQKNPKSSTKNLDKYYKEYDKLSAQRPQVATILEFLKSIHENVAGKYYKQHQERVDYLTSVKNTIQDNYYKTYKNDIAPDKSQKIKETAQKKYDAEKTKRDIYLGSIREEITREKIPNPALAGFAYMDVINLKNFIGKDFPRIKNIDAREDYYLTMSFTQKEISLFQEALKNFAADTTKMASEIEAANALIQKFVSLKNLDIDETLQKNIEAEVKKRFNYIYKEPNDYNTIHENLIKQSFNAALNNNENNISQKMNAEINGIYKNKYTDGESPTEFFENIKKKIPLEVSEKYKKSKFFTALKALSDEYEAHYGKAVAQLNHDQYARGADKEAVINAGYTLLTEKQVAKLEKKIKEGKRWFKEALDKQLPLLSKLAIEEQSENMKQKTSSHVSFQETASSIPTYPIKDNSANVAIDKKSEEETSNSEDAEFNKLTKQFAELKAKIAEKQSSKPTQPAPTTANVRSTFTAKQPTTLKTAPPPVPPRAFQAPLPSRPVQGGFLITPKDTPKEQIEAEATRKRFETRSLKPEDPFSLPKTKSAPVTIAFSAQQPNKTLTPTPPAKTVDPEKSTENTEVNDENTTKFRY